MRRTLLLFAALSLVFAACGDDDDDDASTDTTAPADDCDDLTGEATFTVTMSDNEFSPSCAVAERTQALTLVNDGSNPHTFTIDGTQVDVEVQPGETSNLEAISDAIAAGTYTAYCRFHGNPDGSGMSMELQAS